MTITAENGQVECEPCDGHGDCPGCDGEGGCHLCGFTGTCLFCAGTGKVDADRIRRILVPADRAPVGLTEEERREMQLARERFTRSTDSEDLADSLSSLMSIIDRLSAAPVDDREREGEVLLDGERLAELEDWLLGAEHHAGCSGEYRKPDGSWAYRCKCGLRELRDERPVSPSVDPKEG